jgi:uncharacterized membrane protein
MRSAFVCLTAILGSHALVPPQRKITPRTGGLGAYSELRAFAGVAAAAKLGRREPCISLAVAAALASIKALPRESAIYAWGWTAVLPLSLALTLIGREPSGWGDGAATRRVGAAFAAGAASSVAGAFVAAKLLRGTLGAAADQGAAALAASYVGGSANFFVVAEAVGLRAGIGLLSALATADVVVMAGYIVLLQGLSARYGAPRRPVEQGAASEPTTGSPLAPALLGALCVAAAAPLRPSLRTAAIALGAVACRRLPASRPAARNLSSWCLAAFYACLGACSPISAVVKAGAPALGLAVAALAGHALLLAACSARGPWSIDEALVASNACVGGPVTAAAFAQATGREDLVVPAVVWGTVGYAGGTGLGMALFRVLC